MFYFELTDDEMARIGAMDRGESPLFDRLRPRNSQLAQRVPPSTHDLDVPRSTPTTTPSPAKRRDDALCLSEVVFGSDSGHSSKGV